MNEGMKTNEPEGYFLKLGIYFIGFVIIFTSLVSASDISVWQGQYYTGTTFNTGTYEFNFSVYDSSIAGEICYSNVTNLTTGDFGEWDIEVENVGAACNNVSKDYFLEIKINGVDQSPRRRLLIWNYLRKDVDEVSTGSIETDTIMVRNGLKELTSSLALSKLDYAEETANATLISQQEYALSLVDINKNISLTTMGESLELKRNRVITAAELAKSFIEHNSNVARLKILEAKNLALLNILNAEDEAAVEAEAALRLIALNLTAQEQSEIVEEALNDSLQEIEANDQEIRFCFSDGTNCNNTFVGNVSANYFIGDGSLLTGITSLEADPYWTGNFSLYNSSWSLDTDTTYSHLSNFTNDLGIGNWTFDKPNYYLNSNPFGYYNSTTLPSAGSESDPYWTGNFSLYNSSWSTTYNSTYNFWAYNQTTPAIVWSNATIQSNNASWLSTYNGTYETKADYPFLGNNFNGSGNFNTLGNVSSNSFIANRIQGEYYSNDSSQGITSTTNYWLCTQANCKTSCQVQIKNGIITGCI